MSSLFTKPFEKITKFKNVVRNFDHEQLDKHTNSNLVNVSFGHPHNKIVSCSWDGTIQIWDSITYECLKSIENGKGRRYYHAIIWDDNTFIAGCNNKNDLQVFSIIPPYPLIKSIKNIPNYRLQKLNDDIIVVRYSEIQIVSFSKEKIVKKFSAGRISDSINHLNRSINYKDLFYINNNRGPSKLIDYKTEKCVKLFSQHNPDGEIIASTVFLNSRNEEILALCFTEQLIYFYNTSYDQFNLNMDLEKANLKTSSIAELDPRSGDYAICCFCIENQLLICGGTHKNVNIYNFNGDDDVIEKTCLEKIVGGTILHISLSQLPTRKNNNELKLCVNGFDPKVHIVSVKGFIVKVKRKQEEIDVLERTLFLIEEKDLYLYTLEEKKRVFVELRFCNSIFFECFRSLL